ncbi:MAG: CopG family transcriptional regulator [Pseudomonadota bacterium]|nr:CopG family transcriptional regulator [Pseudomonadota bacterium]
MLALQLPPEIEKRLDELAARTGRTKWAHALEAVLTYIEDMEDAYLAQQALDEGGERFRWKT